MLEKVLVKGKKKKDIPFKEDTQGREEVTDTMVCGKSSDCSAE